MKYSKIIEREETPTIPIGEVNIGEGFILVTSRGENIGIIVYDAESQNYVLICDFNDYFSSGISYDDNYYNSELKNLMKEIESDYNSPVEFNFFKVVQ